jgi:hypothetical protein
MACRQAWREADVRRQTSAPPHLTVGRQARQLSQWLVLKVVLLPCSVSVCEHRWSIQGWIHSKRRNRLGQDLVERLVRTHTNLQFEHRLELYETGMLPWDIKMTVEESLSDDEDGVPHGVSDSESESDKDSD